VTEIKLAHLELRITQLEALLEAHVSGPRPPVAREQMALEAVR
jgi:hypothetical protein